MNIARDIAPAILRCYPQLDPGQLELVAHLDGPTLGVAGPGAGKTLAVALRGVNILLRGEADPGELVLCTYNKRAAAELRERFGAVVRATGYRGDVDRVRIGTIHSLCHRLLRTRARRVGLRPDFQVLNQDGEFGLLAQRFDHIFGPDLGDLETGGWRWREPRLVVKYGQRYFDRISDELISAQDLAGSPDRFLAALGRCCRRYEELLLSENLADFGHLQRWAAELLDDDVVADEISGGIRQLLCDEYQDTSCAQERLLLRLSRRHGNLCVVGDEDQGLYRFRGASVRNILEFAGHHPACRVVELTVNYRSHPAIVGFYDGWMATAADWSNPDGGPPYRHDKTIIPHDPGRYADYPAVIAIDGRDPADEKRQLVDLLGLLRRGGVIAGYDRVAVLLHSVRGQVAGAYLDALDTAGIPANRAPAGPGPGGKDGKRRPGVTVTTIHQAKGREWDVVVVGSLDFDNREADPAGWDLASHAARPTYEPFHRIADFDHARQHYVAFSRARQLLILTAAGPVHPRFAGVWAALPRWDSIDRAALECQRFGAEGDEVPAPRVIPFLRRLDVWMRITRGPQRLPG